MEPLITLRDQDIFPRQHYEAVTSWEERRTVKIIIKKEGKIALITNPISNIYLLPGGGIENDEDILKAANRESEEEAGCSIKFSKIIGCTEEYRGRDKKHYITYGVLAEADKPIINDLRTENEKKIELSVHWFDNDTAKNIFDEQLKRLENGEIKFYHTGFNIVRDRIFFERAFSTSRKNTVE